MALTEQTVLDQITIDEWGNIGVRVSLRIERDGVQVSMEYHRHVVHIGDDLTGEHPKVVAVAEALWPPAFDDWSIPPAVEDPSVVPGG